MTARGSAGAIGLALAVLTAAAGCERAEKPAAQAPAAAREAKPAYATELAALTQGIESGLAHAKQKPDDGLVPMEVVGLYTERARLTGDYADYGRAQALIDAQPANALPAPGRCMAQARLHYTLHRLQRARTTLESCPPNTPPDEVAALRADIALHSGRYAEAGETYRALVNQSPGPQHFARLAQLRKVTGAPGEASALLEAAERRYHGRSATMKAWLKLQRGLVALDQGRLEEALALYRAAEAELPGWWLVEEHIAEVLQLRGDTARAKAMYESIVQRTGAPEFMDALAAIEQAQGGEARARELLDRARAAYEQRIAAFPEAAAGHALDHFLHRPEDAARALALAEGNFRTRPSGEAAVGLAKALLLADAPAKRAAAVIESQLAAGWDTAEARWILAIAHERAGKPREAERGRALALRQNPESPRMYALPR